MRVTAGQRVGGYRLLRVIGEGGMGVVHLGLDPSDRAVAVKVVRPHVAADPQTRARLAREVRSLLKVRHPRVAEVLDADFDAELPYVVMRYVPGEALDAVVRRDGPLAGQVLDELAVGLFEAVQAIHAVGVVHRDLKPGNVLLLDGSPVVIDFGIARALDDVALTSTGLMVGTPGYLSPEVLDGTDVGPGADWWGWGAVVAFAATGRPPFRSGPMEAVWDRVRRGAVDLDGAPEPLARVLAATLRPDPATRPSPEELAAGIASVTGRRPALGGGSSEPVTSGRTREQARPAAAAAPGGASVLTGSGARAGGAGPVGEAAELDRTAVQPVVRPAAQQDAADRTAVQPTVPRRSPEPAPRRHEEVPQTPPTRVVQRPAPSPPAPQRTYPQGRPSPQRHPAQGYGAAQGRTAPQGYRPSPGYPAQQTHPAQQHPAQQAYPPHPAVGRSSPVPVAASSLTPVPTGTGPYDGRPAPAQPRVPYGSPPVPGLPRRPGMGLLGLLVVVAVAVVAPVAGAVAVLAWSAVARAVQWSRVAAAMARVRSGRLRAGARTGIALMYPLRLLWAAVVSALYLLLDALLLSPLLAAGGYLLLQDLPWGSWTAMTAELTQPAVLSGGVVLGALLLWFGPGGRAVRTGSRAVTEPVARTRNGRLVLAGATALVVVAAALVLTSRI